jgi:hypothetical protein
MQPRILARWLLLAGLLLAAFLGTVTTLNLTLYSASGFVSSYLHALARHDVEGALTLPGVQVAGGGSDELMAPGALATLDGIHLVSDADDGAGEHTVSYGYTVGGVPGRSSFTVEHTGARLGLFSGWRFATSPESVLSITPLHGDGFDANGVALVSTAGPGLAHRYRVLTPALVELSHTSTYFTASKTRTLVDTPGVVVNAVVDIRANTVFVREVQLQLDKFLAACVTQKVLLPTGCPMGKQITDRIQDAPTWSITRYPAVTIVPGDRDGTWQVPETAALAHLVVTVRSIFDGSLSTFDQDVPLTVSYLITFAADGSPVIAARY